MANYTKICPKCGSTDIQNDYSVAAEWAAGASPGFICAECGFVSKLFPEIEENKVEKFKAKIKPHSHKYIRLSDDYGKGYIYGVGKIVGPFLLITSLIPIAQYVNKLISEGYHDRELFFLSVWTLIPGVFFTYYAYKKRNY